jgi:hypothetical protein
MNTQIKVFLCALSFLFACSPRQQAQKPAGPGSKPGALELGANIHTNSGPELEIFSKMGGAWVRMDMVWADMEPEAGKWNYATVDACVDACRGAGLKIYATLAYAPAWASSNGKTNGVPAKEAWKNFVGKIVERYGTRVAVFGIWNEPNLGEFWAGGVEEYVNIVLRPASEIIHRQAPGVLVAGPDLSHAYSARLGLQEFFKRFSALGGGAWVDVLSHHIYGDLDFSQKVSGFKRGRIIYRNGLVQMLQKTGLWGRELWITEMGMDARAKGGETQAKVITGQLNVLCAETWIRKAFIYVLKDDPNSSEQFGLLRGDLSPRPAFEALRQWQAAGR